MRICHVITRMIVGGAQENTHLTCAGLAERGHEVLLVSGPEVGPEGCLFNTLDTVPYARRTLDSLRRRVHPARDLQARRELIRLFRQWRPDVVHTHSSKAGILGRLAARAADVPVIVHTIHGMSFNRTQPAWLRAAYRAAERYCGRRCHHLITVAEAMTRQAVAAGLAPPDHFTTIYSGMCTEWFSPERFNRRAVRAAWGFSEDHLVVGTVARLFRNKGYEQLIPAMARVARERPEARFLWVGDGAQREEYLAALGRLGLRERTVLTGLLPPPRIPEVLAGLDLLVHTSQWEGLPRVAVQALLMECPVVSFDIDGAPEVVIPGRTGLLVPLNDIAGLSEAILDLLADPARRRQFGQAGRALCRERFDHRRMVDQIAELYRKLIEQRHCRGSPLPESLLPGKTSG